MSTVMTKPYKMDEMIRAIRPPKPIVDDVLTSMTANVNAPKPYKKTTL